MEQRSPEGQPADWPSEISIPSASRGSVPSAQKWKSSPVEESAETPSTRRGRPQRRSQNRGISLEVVACVPDQFSPECQWKHIAYHRNPGKFPHACSTLATSCEAASRRV